MTYAATMTSPAPKLAERNLMQASRQWATRPDDERFASVQEMHDFASAVRAAATTKVAADRSLRFRSEGDDVVLVGSSGRQAHLTDYAFRQACSFAGAPAAYLSTLPSDLAAQALDLSFQRRAQGKDKQLLFHQNGHLTLRAMTSDSYARIWNAEVTEVLLRLQDVGWVVPPARPSPESKTGIRRATLEDVAALEWISGGGGAKVNVGDEIAPAGLYASQHDCFAFMIDPTRRIDDGSPGGLCRGLMLGNSEVGQAALEITGFYMRGVCGNHICWGASGVKTARIIHVGRARERWSDAYALAENVRNASAAGDEAAIKRLQATRIADEADDVVSFLRAKSKVTLRDAEASLLECTRHGEECDPLSYWGVAQGLTYLSQRTPYADKRTDLDWAAGRVLELCPA